MPGRVHDRRGSRRTRPPDRCCALPHVCAQCRRHARRSRSPLRRRATRGGERPGAYDARPPPPGQRRRDRPATPACRRPRRPGGPLRISGDGHRDRQADHRAGYLYVPSGAVSSRNGNDADRCRRHRRSVWMPVRVLPGQPPAARRGCQRCHAGGGRTWRRRLPGPALSPDGNDGPGQHGGSGGGSECRSFGRDRAPAVSTAGRAPYCTARACLVSTPDRGASRPVRRR